MISSAINLQDFLWIILDKKDNKDRYISSMEKFFGNFSITWSLILLMTKRMIKKNKLLCSNLPYQF